MDHALSKKHIQNIFSTLAKNTPSPRGELKYKNTFTLLVAVVLSAQATDKMVNEVTQELFPMINHPRDIIAMGEEQLMQRISRIGLYRNKARNIVALSAMLIEHHDSVVPDTLEELIALPGVGRKTANVVLNIAFNQPTIAVDTHVLRTSQRLGLSKGKTPDHVEADLMRVIPKVYLTNAHHWLILHGRYVCKARKPLCVDCPISKWCSWEGKTED